MSNYTIETVLASNDAMIDEGYELTLYVVLDHSTPDVVPVQAFPTHEEAADYVSTVLEADEPERRSGPPSAVTFSDDCDGTMQMIVLYALVDTVVDLRYSDGSSETVMVCEVPPGSCSIRVRSFDHQAGVETGAERSVSVESIVSVHVL